VFVNLTPAYDDVVYHDVAWGTIKVEPAMNLASPEIQAILSTGLSSVYRLATAETYAARHELLYRWGGPRRKDDFFYEGLARRFPARFPSLPPYLDLDLGPRRAWEWAYASSRRNMKIYHRSREVLRRWGYVFRDKARLDDIALFDKPFVPPRLPPERHEPSDEFTDTWWAREEISRAGGSGYWTPTDQSRVVNPAASKRSHPTVGRRFATPSFANAKRESSVESARIEAAMQNKWRKTEDS